MNVYGDVVTEEMARAHRKIVALALNGTEAKLSLLARRKRVRVELEAISRRLSREPKS